MSVLVGYDGSDLAIQALDWALDEAELRKLPLTVVHSWQWPYGTADEDVRRHLRVAAEHVLWHGAERARARRSVTRVDTDLYEGHPAERLVRLSTGADLVVVGSRGLGALRRTMVGSVAAHVAAHARCPVVVVRGHGPPPAPRHRGPVAAVAARPPCDALLDFALQEAALRRLTLLAARTGAHHGPPPDDRLAAAEDEWRQAVLARHACFPGVPVDTEVETGAPREVVEALSCAASLLVVGGAHAGPVTRAALEHAVCPVAVIRPQRMVRSAPTICPDGTFAPGPGATTSG